MDQGFRWFDWRIRLGELIRCGGDIWSCVFRVKVKREERERGRESRRFRRV